MVRVLMVASEAVPFAKTGGLGDVLGALPQALREHGVETAVVLPRYRGVEAHGRVVLEGLRIWVGGFPHEVWVYEAASRGVPYYLVECPEFFDREGIYFARKRDYPDNHARFALLNKAAIAVARWVFRPNVIHGHDWPASLAPIYLRTVLANDPVFIGTRVVLTIHNLGYQGIFPPSVLGEIGLDGSVFHPEGVEFFGQVNLLKGGIVYSDAITTVSRTYALEIQTPEFGHGLEGVLASRRNVLVGILNGVDYTHWDPSTDKYLPANYSLENLEGKQICKKALLQEMGLPPEAEKSPLVGMVSRLVNQKGLDLVEAAAGELVKTGACFVILAVGEARYERFLREWSASHPGQVAVRIAYDEGLAHRIEGGADIFLMPSLYEPCGLNQIYSLKYGTVPVVRAVGGLADTVDEGTGFKFNEYSPEAMLAALRQAIAAFQNPGRWVEIQKNGMRKDYSWRASAAEYARLYEHVLSVS